MYTRGKSTTGFLRQFPPWRDSSHVWQTHVWLSRCLGQVPSAGASLSQVTLSFVWRPLWYSTIYLHTEQFTNFDLWLPWVNFRQGKTWESDMAVLQVPFRPSRFTLVIPKNMMRHSKAGKTHGGLLANLQTVFGNCTYFSQ